MKMENLDPRTGDVYYYVLPLYLKLCNVHSSTRAAWHSAVSPVCSSTTPSQCSAHQALLSPHLGTHIIAETQLHGFCPAPALMRTLGELGLQRRSSVQRRSPIEVHSCLPELRC